MRLFQIRNGTRRAIQHRKATARSSLETCVDLPRCPAAQKFIPAAVVMGASFHVSTVAALTAALMSLSACLNTANDAMLMPLTSTRSKLFLTVVRRVRDELVT